MLRSEEVSSDMVEAFHTDGAVVLRQCVDERWLGRIGEAIERDIVTPGPFYHGYVPADGQGKFHGNLRLWETDADCRAFCMDSGLALLAKTFLRSEKINLLYDQLFVKEPSTANPTRWHNDQPYWPIRGAQVVSFWVALDQTVTDSGALEFVRGSHLWGRWFQPEKFGDTDGHDAYERNPNYEPMPDIDADRAAYDIVTWDLEPGDVYVFHGLTVHGARGNARPDLRRRGYTVRYTGDDVVYDTRPGPNEHLRSAELNDGDPLDSARYPRVLLG